MWVMTWLSSPTGQKPLMEPHHLSQNLWHRIITTAVHDVSLCHGLPRAVTVMAPTIKVKLCVFDQFYRHDVSFKKKKVGGKREEEKLSKAVLLSSIGGLCVTRDLCFVSLYSSHHQRIGVACSIQSYWSGYSILWFETVFTRLQSSLHNTSNTSFCASPVKQARANALSMYDDAYWRSSGYSQ